MIAVDDWLMNLSIGFLIGSFGSRVSGLLLKIARFWTMRLDSLRMCLRNNPG